jgi:hypothetical protein
MRVARFALLSLAACTGTDTGNPPVIDFRNSACHDQSYSTNKDVILQSLEEGTLVPDPRFKGLTCFVSELRADSLHLLVSNYMAACGSEGGWTPRVAERSDGGLDLILEDADCAVAKCGWCLYDLSFDLPREYATARSLHLYQQGCDGDPMEITTQLALTETEAAACAYTSANALMWKGRGDTGERMLCGSWPDGYETGTCDLGLTCSELTSDPTWRQGGGRCLRNCATDIDCDGLSVCTSGVCQLKATGVETVP